MDSVLCDELLQEVFQRLPPSAAAAASLVCKRWLQLHRAAKSSISLRLPLHSPTIPSLSSFLSLYPHLSSLTLISPHHPHHPSDRLLAAVAASTSSDSLRRLRFFAGPVPASSLLALSSSCPNLTSLSISLHPPLSFHWLLSFPSLRDLSFTNASPKSEPHNNSGFDDREVEFETNCDDFDGTGKVGGVELPLESLCLSGIGVCDKGLGWLWRSCTKLRRLKLRSCEGLGDGSAFNSFFRCLKGLQELELRTCRSVVDWVLLQLAQHCLSLESLLLYDGGNRDALLRFITESKSALKGLDLRLPLDLENDHLSAVAENFRGLASIRLQSCCLVTGEGLKRLSSELGSGLEELGLINCDVVERESGLLANLGQKLRGLKKLDLSYNEMLSDKELVSMLVSCKDLVEIKLRGCKGLTEATLLCILKSCKFLETLDITQCCGIGADVVEVFVVESKRLRQVYVEQSKVSDAAKSFSCLKFMEVVVS